MYTNVHKEARLDSCKMPIVVVVVYANDDDGVGSDEDDEDVLSQP
jgi:hypothetical protein